MASVPPSEMPPTPTQPAQPDAVPTELPSPMPDTDVPAPGTPDPAPANPQA